MRLFVAVDPAEPERRRLADELAAARREGPRAGWSPGHQLHLTLAFLGEVEEGRVGAALDALRAAARAGGPFATRFAAVGGFPDLPRPRVLWIGFDPAAPLVALAGAVGEALRERGFPLERREAVPHLTLARLRHPWPPGEVDRWAARFSGRMAGEPLVVDRLRLVRSRLEPRGAIHEGLGEVPLAADASPFS